MKHLQTTLIDVNEDSTHCVQLHPLFTNTGMSVDQLYAELVVREDLAAIQHSSVINSSNHSKVVKCPSDLFIKDDRPAKNVFMLGQPGYGKTTFCLYLLKLWCTAKTVFDKSRLSIWQAEMNVFDFVFYISLRHVDRSRCSVIEMICEDVFERDDGNRDVIGHVLESCDNRCLIVVDGLDEWVFSPEAQEKLRNKGLPNTLGLSANCTVLFASRHWKIDLIQPKYSQNDIVVEISGLTDKGVNTIIQNILEHFFKLDIESEDYKTKLEDLKNQLKNSKFESSKRIPMLVTIFVFLGFDGTFDQRSVTGLAFNQLALLIMRAIEKDVIKEEDITMDISAPHDIEIPMIIQQSEYLSKLMFVLYKLGKIAFNDLVSTTSHLVFDKNVLSKQLGKRELDLALKVGIVGQMQAPGRYHIPKVSIEFFHKSIQEAVAALYIVCDKSKAFSSLCENCCTIENVFEMSNVLLYVAGISPAVACEFSNHIVRIASKDEHIVKEREDLNLIYKKIDMRAKARKVYNLQYEFYKEMDFTSLSISNLSINYHLPDIVLHYTDTDDKVSITSDMMRGAQGSILSFAMWIRHATSWSAVLLLQILPNCSQPTTLQLRYDRKTPEPELASVLPTLKHLQWVQYWHLRRYDEVSNIDSRVVRIILQLPQLKYVKLVYVGLDDFTLAFRDRMTQLQKIELDKVRMSPYAWNKFVTSLLSVRHAVEVNIECCSTIDDDIRKMISNSDRLTLSEDFSKDKERDSRFYLSFTCGHKEK